MQDFKNPDLFSIFRPNNDSLKRKREMEDIELKSDKRLKLEKEDPLKILEEIKLSTMEKDKNEQIEEEEEEDKKENKKHLLEDFEIETYQEDCGCLHETVSPKNFPRNGIKIKNNA